MPLSEIETPPISCSPKPAPWHQVAIIGGGLAGLTVARHLTRAGIDSCLIEARDRLGGRILSVDAAGMPDDDGFDLGPSWFWPQMHRDMATLVSDLGLAAFPQASEGDMLFQRANGRVDRYPGMYQDPRSMRLSGGTGALVRALAASVPQSRIHLRTSATHLRISSTDVMVEVNRGEEFSSIRAEHIVFALPPRLLAERLVFHPAPDPTLLARWRQTPTWMAPHAKFFALYNRPFWRAAGLSGMAHSQMGPLGEIHDATTASGQAALFGFVGLPAAHRRQPEIVVTAAVAQLAQIFGPEALTPQATLYKDWAADTLTATALDQAGGAHPAGGRQIWTGPEWHDRVILAGSETASRDPGYLAGAIEAGTRAATQIVSQLQVRGR